MTSTRRRSGLATPSADNTTEPDATVPRDDGAERRVRIVGPDHVEHHESPWPSGPRPDLRLPRDPVAGAEALARQMGGRVVAWRYARALIDALNEGHRP
jgi:hypothetical protein